jgi:hypothetical protein
LLLPIRSRLVPRLPELGVSSQLDSLLWAQLVSLALAALVVVVVVTAVPGSRRFLRVGEWGADVEPVPAIGLKPKPHETWKHVGLNFAVVLTVVTAVVVGMQVGWPSASLLPLTPWILLLSLCNATVEEMLTRFAVVGSLQEVIGNRSRWVAAALFGGVHYWGTPSGLPGVVLAGFLGWLLAKSVQETRGMGWAIVLHMLQDVVIFAALLSQPRG